MRKTMKSCIGLLAALGCVATAAADGGVTFNNIAAGDGAGITYRRATSPDREAVHIAARQGVIPLAQFPAFVRESAQKWHGAPGVAILDFDKDGDLDIYVPNGPGRNNSLYSNQLVQTGLVSFVAFLWPKVTCRAL